MGQLDTIFAGLHNSASSLLRLQCNTPTARGLLFNNETADKCGRLVTGATGSRNLTMKRAGMLKS